MDFYTVLKQALDKHLELNQIKTVITGKVTDVQDENTCTVEIAEGVELYAVRLHSAIDSLQNKVTMVPAIGSIVAVARMENIAHEAVVIAWNEVAKYRVKIGTAVFQVTPNKLSIQAAGKNLRTELSNFIDEVIKIVVLYGRGPNVPALAQIKVNIETILD